MPPLHPRRPSPCTGRESRRGKRLHKYSTPSILIQTWFMCSNRSDNKLATYTLTLLAEVFCLAFYLGRNPPPLLQGTSLIVSIA